MRLTVASELCLNLTSRLKMLRRNRTPACCALSIGPVRRTRHARLLHATQPAFMFPAAAATALAAAAAFAAAIRALLSGRLRRRMVITVKRAQRRVLARVRQPAVMSSAPVMYANALDELRSRASAKLDAAGPRLVPADPIVYGSLPAQRRAELLDEALRSARLSASTAPPPAPVTAPPPVQPSDWNAAIAFWRVAERMNGRAAAIGLALCLLREAVEPTHPSLLTQVRDVLVPVAINTPPFLVAVVDRITDWLT